MDQYDRFMDYYPAVRYVLSMRKHVNSRVISKFMRYSLQPFDMEQAVMMVGKLDKYVISKETKEDFIDSLKNSKNGIDWEKQKAFLGNPLLLSIMLMAYDENYEIPTQRYVFYQRAYEAMAKKHDATKNLRREFRTGLTMEKFQLYFGEFCAATYAQEKYEFKENELKTWIEGVIKANNINTTVDLFIADIVEKLCIMFKDGEDYQFVHRSFQEYFTAYFFSKQDAVHFKPIYNMFLCYDESRHDDEVISMLYGMADRSTELHIVIPFLREILGEKEETGYGFFLDRIFPCMYFVDGECAPPFDTDDTDSALYNFIRTHYHINQNTRLEVIKDMPYCQPLMTFYYVPEFWQDTDNPGKLILTERDNIDPEYFEMYNCEDEVAGYLYEISLMDVTRDAERNMPFLEHVFSDSFPLKVEYDMARELLQTLEKKYEEKPDDGNNFFSMFH